MLLMLAVLFACAPTCERTCKKLLACEGIEAPHMNIDECTSACSAQQNLYEEWDDPDKEEAFKNLKSCIVSSECDGVESGVCYDDSVYIW